MAYFENIRYKRETEQLGLGGGENTYQNPFNIDNNQSSESRNCSTEKLPSLTVRKGRVSYAGSVAVPITNINGISTRDDSQLFVHSNTTWKRWTGSAYIDTALSMANSQSKVIEFNTSVSRFTIFTDGTNVRKWNGSTLTTVSAAPTTILYALDDYRLYALKGTVLKCSDTNDPDNWTTGDSATLYLVSMRGDGTAVATYNDMTICWSEQDMHLLYGNDPDDFTFSLPVPVGCIAHRTPLVHKGVLYWLDFNKFYAFTSGFPVDISRNVYKYLSNINLTYKTLCCVGASDRFIYLSIPYGSTATTNNITLVFDIENNIWNVLDIGILDFTNISEFLYGIDTDGVIWTFENGTSDDSTAISWYFITKVRDEGSVRSKKTISDIWSNIDLPVSSTLTISYSETVDGDDFVTLYTYTANAEEQNTRVKVPVDKLQNIDWYRLKFSGTGPCTIYKTEIYYRVKAR